MASIRNLKKNLNYLTLELMTECLTYKHFHKDGKQESFEAAIKGVIENHNDLIHRCGKADMKADANVIKTHFKAIRSDFDKSLKAMDNLAK